MAAVEFTGGTVEAVGVTMRIGDDWLGAVVVEEEPFEAPAGLVGLLVEFCPAGSQWVAGVTPLPAGDWAAVGCAMVFGGWANVGVPYCGATAA